MDAHKKSQAEKGASGDKKNVDDQAILEIADQLMKEYAELFKKLAQ